MGGFVVFTVGCVKRTAPDQRARAAASPKIMAPPGYCDIVLCPLEFRLRSLSGRGAETPEGPRMAPRRTFRTTRGLLAEVSRGRRAAPVALVGTDPLERHGKRLKCSIRVRHGQNPPASSRGFAPIKN